MKTLICASLVALALTAAPAMAASNGANSVKKSEYQNSNPVKPEEPKPAMAVNGPVPRIQYDYVRTANEFTPKTVVPEGDHFEGRKEAPAKPMLLRD